MLSDSAFQNYEWYNRGTVSEQDKVWAYTDILLITDTKTKWSKSCNHSYQEWMSDSCNDTKSDFSCRSLHYCWHQSVHTHATTFGATCFTSQIWSWQLDGQRQKKQISIFRDSSSILRSYEIVSLAWWAKNNRWKRRRDNLALLDRLPRYSLIFGKKKGVWDLAKHHEPWSWFKTLCLGQANTIDLQ